MSAYWYLRDAWDLRDAHFGEENPDGTVISRCGATFTPAAVFNLQAGPGSAGNPPGLRAGTTCQKAPS